MKQEIVFETLNEQTYRFMNAMRENASLLDCLIALQTAEGIDEATAQANAEACILAVAQWDSLYHQACGNSMDIMEGLLKKLARLEESDRLLALHKILFGLTAYHDPDTARKLDSGALPDQLFRSHYEAILRSGNAPDAATLEAQIRHALESYHISPTAMRMLTLQMRHGKGYLATAEALGEDGRNLKCLMTMEVWLRNRDTMTMEEAASTAIPSAQYQAVADALRRGYIARDVAKALLIALGITVAIFGILYMIHTMPMVMDALANIANLSANTAGPMSPLLKSILEKQFAAKHAGAIFRQSAGALIFLSGGAMAFLSDKAADLIGKLTVRFAHLFRPAADAPVAALEDVVHEMEQPAPLRERERAPAPAPTLPDEEDAIDFASF